MNDELHTLHWLRRLRDGRAEAEKGLPSADILARTRERAGDLLAQFLRSHPDAVHSSPRVASVAVGEGPGQYGPSRPRQREGDRA